MHYNVKYRMLWEHKAIGLSLVAEGWGESVVVRENLEEMMFELHVDRRLVLSRQS